MKSSISGKCGLVSLVKKTVLFLNVFVICIMGLTGCKNAADDKEGRTPVEFTVVEEADIPAEFLKIINEKKKEPFKISYTNKESMYIARGYGEQKSGGYSIKVTDLSCTETRLYFATELIGPSENEPVTRSATYPYIVVKIEYMEKEVVIDQ